MAGDKFHPDTTRRLSRQLLRSERTPRLSLQRQRSSKAVPFKATQRLVAGGRLTLNSAIETMLELEPDTDQTNKTRLYYRPFVEDRIFLYSGTKWSQYSFDDLGCFVDVSDVGVHDVFAYYDTEEQEVALETAPWSSDSFRTASNSMVRVNGVLVKNDEADEPEGLRYTRRFLGTIYYDSGFRLCDAVARRFVWNNYNRITKKLHQTTGNLSVVSSTSDQDRLTIRWVSGDDGTVADVYFAVKASVSGAGNYSFRIHESSNSGIIPYLNNLGVEKLFACARGSVSGTGLRTATIKDKVSAGGISATVTWEAAGTISC